MHNKDLHIADTRCQKSIIDNVGCAFCRGVKRCEAYPQDVDKLMEHKNKTWNAEWRAAHIDVEDYKLVKRLKHKQNAERNTEHVMMM
jgi:hypothetical protein